MGLFGDSQQEQERQRNREVSAMLIGQGFEPFGTLFQLQLRAYPKPINTLFSPKEIAHCQEPRGILQKTYDEYISRIDAANQRP